MMVAKFQHNHWALVQPLCSNLPLRHPQADVGYRVAPFPIPSAQAAHGVCGRTALSPATRRRRSAFWWLAIAAVLGVVRVARADIDLTGTWDLFISLLPGSAEQLTVVQTGISVSMTIGGSTSTGMIDPVGGSFFVSSNTSLCHDFTLVGLAAPDGGTMRGTGTTEVIVPGVPTPEGCVTLGLDFAAVRQGAAPACGDGKLDPGESCDDGNRLFGDCCTPICTLEPAGRRCTDDGRACTLDICDGAGACTHPAAPAGTICRAVAGSCDVAEVCDGVSPSCPADEVLPAGTECGPSGACNPAETCDGSTAFCPQPPDSDLDGVPDPCDVCPNGIMAEAPRLRLGKYDGKPGNDVLIAAAAFPLSSAAAAFLDPVAQGLQIVVDREPGITRELDVVVPPGLFDPVTRQGWKVGKSGLTWTFRGADPTLAVTRVSVELSLKKGRRVAVKATGKRRTYAAAALPAPPLVLALVLEPPGATSPACGEVAFRDPGRCKLESKGTVLDCR
jgi:cysteine-rich repeat protein